MATHEDAALVAQLLQWSAQNGLDDALLTIFSDNFEPETVTTQDPAVHKVLGFGEVVGTFVKQNVLDRDLVHDLWAMEYSWKRVGPAALKLREKTGEPRLYENFEALVRQGVPAGAAR